jgi:hypothetical protein
MNESLSELNDENDVKSESFNKKETSIKESPLKFLHPYFTNNNNNKTPVKSKSLFDKYSPVVLTENDENKSNNNKNQIKKNDKLKSKKSFDINNDIPSPRKQTFTNQPKLKQLTMTQAFITQLNSPKKLNQSSNNNDVLKIKQSNSFYQENTLKNGSNESLSAKFKNLSNLVTFDPDETCLSSVFNNVKSEPVS